MSHICYFIPPHLLDAISKSETNSEGRRSKAKTSLDAHNEMTNARKERLTSMAQSSAEGAQYQHQHGVVPQQVLQRLSESQDVDEKTRSRAKRDLEITNKALVGDKGGQVPIKEGTYRSVYDAKHTERLQALPGTLVRAEGEKPVKDKEGNATNEAYDNVGIVLDFYLQQFKWKSIDNKNMDVVSSVHFGVEYENACKCNVPEPARQK